MREESNLVATKVGYTVTLVKCLENLYRISNLLSVC